MCSHLQISLSAIPCSSLSGRGYPSPGTTRGAVNNCKFLLPRIVPQHCPVIPGEDTACQAKFSGVGSLHNLLLCVKGQDGHDRPKDLFLHTRHVILAVPYKGSVAEHKCFRRKSSSTACVLSNSHSLGDSTQHGRAARHTLHLKSTNSTIPVRPSNSTDFPGCSSWKPQLCLGPPSKCPSTLGTSQSQVIKLNSFLRRNPTTSMVPRLRWILPNTQGRM